MNVLMVYLVESQPCNVGDIAKRYKN